MTMMTVVSGELHVLNSYLVWLKEQGISAQLLTRVACFPLWFNGTHA
jgi:hypothetical protein